MLREVGRQLFPPDARAPRQARSLVSRLLRHHGLEHSAPDAALLTSELATNAVAHAQSRFMVTVYVNRTRARIEVLGPSRALPVLTLAGDDFEPLGLRIVDAFASSWGARSIPDDGKLVWFEVTEAV